MWGRRTVILYSINNHFERPYKYTTPSGIIVEHEPEVGVLFQAARLNGMYEVAGRIFFKHELYHAADS